MARFCLHLWKLARTLTRCIMGRASSPPWFKRQTWYHRNHRYLHMSVKISYLHMWGYHIVFINRPRSIYKYSSMAPRLSGQNCKFSSFFCSPIPKRDLDTKKTTPNIEVWPERLGAMLEYWYIKRGLFTVLQIMPFALIWNINHLMNIYPVGRQVTLLRINLYVNWSGKNLSKLMTSVD